ncbi:glycine/D-amino acid oxidase-like deaminating enzyme [Novosphingobium sp. SG751A]|uniref:NAD(P)/FAD-dependent oxidoreductase n=1 Tax=Novosphingobium sp. SG751A TaxID=2587000 RepID=UPI001554A12E|nr:FAD-binding oxidoreductase [Novosphingobium sp. SG751A]NOW45098.1 glycine/D-amino acid oxidase-like deaminating enzyme [Novosphingobium sp. SG751A]
MHPVVQPVASDEHLPEAVDVVVVGGGIVGTASAYYLARRGLSVALVEKGYVGCEQSSRTWGWCRQQNRDPREMPLSLLSMRLWDNLRGEIGRDLGFRRTGLVYATDDAAVLAGWEAWGPVAREFGVDTHMLTAAQAAQRIPQNRRQWVGGLHSVADGKAEPALAAPALAEGARQLGATIHQGCAARGLDLTQGRISGLHTERGTIRADAVLCAAGAWASTFMRRHGVIFPQASVRQTALRTKPTVNLGEVLYCPDLAMTRRLDGSYTLAISGRATLEITPQGLRFGREFMPQFIQRLKAVQLGLGGSFFSGPESLPALWGRDPAIFENTRVLSPAPNRKLVGAIMANLVTTFPQLAGLEMDAAWGAYVDCTPDAVPVVSAVEQIGGLCLAAGCSGHGFGLGPGIGHLAAELVANDRPSVDPAHFRLDRLVDGSRIKVGSL